MDAAVRARASEGRVPVEKAGRGTLCDDITSCILRDEPIGSQSAAHAPQSSSGETSQKTTKEWGAATSLGRL